MNACWLQRNDNDVSVWLYKGVKWEEEKRKWDKMHATFSYALILLSSSYLYIFCTFFQSTQQFSFCPSALLTCHPFFFSPPRTPSPTSFSHCCIHRACLYSVFGSLALSRGWHCAMVVEGLCPDASWLSVWDFRRLDQRREVKWEKGGKRGLLQRERAKSRREKGRGKRWIRGTN